MKFDCADWMSWWSICWRSPTGDASAAPPTSLSRSSLSVDMSSPSGATFFSRSRKSARSRSPAYDGLVMQSCRNSLRPWTRRSITSGRIRPKRFFFGIGGALPTWRSSFARKSSHSRYRRKTCHCGCPLLRTVMT